MFYLHYGTVIDNSHSGFFSMSICLLGLAEIYLAGPRILLQKLKVLEIGFTCDLVSGQNFMYQIAFHRFENAGNSVPHKMVELRHRPWFTVSARNDTFRLLLCILIDERKF